MTHVRSTRDFTVVNHDFIGNKCNNAGLHKVIIIYIDNILTGKRDLGFSLMLTNAIVIELYH